jgi:CRISPR type III-A-associated protein Csm2
MADINLKWITGDSPIDNLTVDWANDFGRTLAQSEMRSPALTTSQIRKFFGEVKRIQSDFKKHKNDVPLLRAKLAYAVGRQKGVGKIVEFQRQFDKGLAAVSGNEENFDRLVKLLESTVAFHKFHNGKD